MIPYLDELIEGVKRELKQEEERVEQMNFRVKKTEAREVGVVKRLQQRLSVLERLRQSER